MCVLPGREEDIMKARCSHRVPWFFDCPWCRSDTDQRREDVTFPFWRAARTPTEKETLVREIVERVFSDVFNSCRRGPDPDRK